MSDIIRLLPDSVANQIAAGEVIQRPASVIKELVENSVDAGATEIEIHICDAGRTLIQVIDNGIGMSPTDARMAFERHATSKITKADDLFSLHTMGFRGEALASIAAVARVELKTRTMDSNIGTKLVINGSKVESQEPEMCAAGSNLMVKSLFFNVPARRKFLKKDSVELSNILREFERLALVNAEVDLSISHNGTLLHKLQKGSLKQRIIELFGKGLEKQIIPVETTTPIVKISGFVTLPQFAKKRNQLQYLFVNGRNMRHPYFHKAILQCYEGLIPADEQPSYWLEFKVDPQTIDVNIHPTKNEIKFEDEIAIWQILVAAVKESLGRYNGMPGIDFSEDVQQIPIFNPTNTASGDLFGQKAYNPFDIKSGKDSYNSKINNNSLKRAGQDWAKLYETFISDSKNNSETLKDQRIDSSLMNRSSETETVNNSIFESSSLSRRNICISVKGKYIILPSTEGLIVIDQNRAHTRILFEQYLTLLSPNDIHSQAIMFPELLTLSPSENIIMHNILPLMLQIGFDITHLGGNDWNLTGYPAFIKNANMSELVRQILIDQTESGVDAEENMIRRLALSMAKASAIKSPTFLSEAEMDHMVAQLFALPISKYTPDGLVIISEIGFDSIARLFE